MEELQLNFQCAIVKYTKNGNYEVSLRFVWTFLKINLRKHIDNNIATTADFVFNITFMICTITHDRFKKKKRSKIDINHLEKCY